MTKFLIIRFSSIGDIIQCMGIIGGIRERFADVEIHWITRKDMVGTLSMDGRIDKIWAFDKETGLAGLLKMAADLRKEHFDYIYDAHSNIRSNILKLIVSPLPFVKPYVALRSKERGKRFCCLNWESIISTSLSGDGVFSETIEEMGNYAFSGQLSRLAFPG